MHYEKRGAEYYWMDKEIILDVRPEVAIAYDEETGALLRHGRLDRVTAWFETFRQKTAAVPECERLFASVRTVNSHAWLPEDLNWMIDCSGSSTRVVDRAIHRPEGAPDSLECRRVAIIGTAGRDEAKRPYMTRELYVQMVDRAKRELREMGVRCPVWLVSGGAAWADHVAVSLWLGRESLLASTGVELRGLSLHLPVPLTDGRFRASKAGAVANRYHRMFSQAIGHRRNDEGEPGSLRDLSDLVGAPGVHIRVPESDGGYGAFFARNALIAEEADYLLAFTWGTGDTPADGGTLDTWKRADHLAGIRGPRRIHVPLDELRGTAPA